MAVTLPPLTEAADELVLLQLILLFVALVGHTVAVRLNLSPFSRYKPVLFNVTESTQIVQLVTVTVI